MRISKDVLVGKRNGRLTIQKEIPPIKDNRGFNVRRFLCLCDCGEQKEISCGNINRTFSCGCLRDEKISRLNASHQRSKTAEYRSWAGMIDRCENNKNPAYINYGGQETKMSKKNSSVYLQRGNSD